MFMTVPMFERSNINSHIQTLAADDAKEGIFQVAKVPMDMYNLNAPQKDSTSYVCFFLHLKMSKVFSLFQITIGQSASNTL